MLALLIRYYQAWKFSSDNRCLQSRPKKENRPRTRQVVVIQQLEQPEKGTKNTAPAAEVHALEVPGFQYAVVDLNFGFPQGKRAENSIHGTLRRR
jgi:hypothetical protein